MIMAHYVLSYKGKPQYTSRERAQLESIAADDVALFGSRRQDWTISIKQ